MLCYQSNITHNHTCPESISWDVHTHTHVLMWTRLTCSVVSPQTLLFSPFLIYANKRGISLLHPPSLTLSLSFSLPPFLSPLLCLCSIPPCISVTLAGSHKRKGNACNPCKVENTGESSIQQSLRANAHGRDPLEM